jgi:DNA ligase-1
VDGDVTFLLDVLKALENEPGRNGKIRILRAGDKKHKALRGVLRYALDPYKRFYVRRIPRLTRKWRTGIPMQDVFVLLDELATRKITGRAAEISVEHALENLIAADQEVFRRVLLKDLRCGVNTKTVNAAFPKLIPTFEVQRAKAWDQERASFPMFTEAKLDGMRVLAFVENDDVEWMSRGGRPVTTMSHFTRALVDLFPNGIVLDGEARTKGKTFQRSISAIKRKASKSGEVVEFTVFDALTPEEFATQTCSVPLKQRRKRLGPLLSSDCEGLSVSQVVRVKSFREIREQYDRLRRVGCDGVMIKDPDGVYDFKRSHVWMKLKPVDTVDAEVTGYKEGTGKYVGMLGALTFKFKGQTCSAGSGLSDNQRTKLWRQRKSLIGKLMEVRFTEETDGGRTRHARFIRFREHRGERD